MHTKRGDFSNEYLATGKPDFKVGIGNGCYYIEKEINLMIRSSEFKLINRFFEGSIYDSLASGIYQPQNWIRDATYYQTLPLTKHTDETINLIAEFKIKQKSKPYTLCKSFTENLSSKENICQCFPMWQPPAMDKKNILKTGVVGIGGIGGHCICPNGQSYFVGQVLSTIETGTLACENGTSDKIIKNQVLVDSPESG
jgi:hypothetical protein